MKGQPLSIAMCIDNAHGAGFVMRQKNTLFYL